MPLPSPHNAARADAKAKKTDAEPDTSKGGGEPLKYACAGDLGCNRGYMRSLNDVAKANDWGFSDTINSDTNRIICPKNWLEKIPLIRDTGEGPHADTKLNLLFRYAAHYKKGVKVRDATSFPMLVPEDYPFKAAQGIYTPFEFRCSVVSRKSSTDVETPIQPSSVTVSDCASITEGERPLGGPEAQQEPNVKEDDDVLVKKEPVEPLATLEKSKVSGEKAVQAELLLERVLGTRREENEESGDVLELEGPPFEDDRVDSGDRAGKRVRLARYAEEAEIPHRQDEPPKSVVKSKFAALLALWEDMGVTIHLTPEVDPKLVRYMTRYNIPLVPLASQGVIVVLPDTLSDPPTSGYVFDMMVEIESRGYGMAVGEDWMVEVLMSRKLHTPVDWAHWRQERRKART